MNPADYLSKDEQSLDLKLAGRIQDISVEVTQLAARTDRSDLEERHVETLSTEFDDLERQHKKLHLDARSRYMATAATKGAQVYRGDLDSDPLGEPGSIEDRTFKNPWNLDEMRAYPFDAPGRNAELRARAMSAIEQMQGTTPARREVMTRMVENHDGSDAMISQRILLSSPDYMSFWGKRLRYGAEAPLTPGEVIAANRAMSLTDASGGFLIPFQLDASVILTADGSLNEIRQIARQVVATGDVWSGVSSAGMTWSWDSENEEVSDDAPTFAQPSIAIHKAQGFIPISIEALADEQNVTGEIARMLAFGKDVLDAAAFATGSGTGEPTGIVTALTGTASIVASTVADTFDAGEVYACENGLPARYRQSGSWLANNGAYGLIREFDTAGGAGMWTRIGEGRPNQLVGRPAYESSDMDGTLTAGSDNYLLIFGDFSNYVIADRIGMTVETIPHLFATANNRPSGNRGFFAWYRVGADSVNDGAFSMLNVT